MKGTEPDFSQMIRQLLVINAGINRLQYVAGNPGEYGKDRIAAAHAQLKRIPAELTIAFNQYATLHMNNQGLENVVRVANNLSNQFNDLTSSLFDWTEALQNKTVVDYGVYMLLDAFVQNRLKLEFPSILGLDIPSQCIPDNAAVIVIPSLGSTAIVFGDRNEARDCFNQYMRFCGQLY